MGAPRKNAEKNIPKSREEDDDDDSLEQDTKKKVDDEDDFDGPLDDLAFEDYGDDEDDDF